MQHSGERHASRKRKQTETYTVPYECHKKRHTKTDVLEDNNDALNTFESFTKQQHRQRIVFDLANAKNASLVYLASPQGSEFRVFRSRLPHVQLTAVNSAEIQSTHPKVETPHQLKDGVQLVDVLRNNPDKSFSHAWLDLMTVDVSMELLSRAVRCCTTKLYLVLNVDRVRNGFYDTKERVLLKSAVLGARIVHEESYVGCSGKFNMMLFVLDLTHANTANVEISETIGRRCWVGVGEKEKPADGYALTTLKGKQYYVGRIFGVNTVDKTYAVQFYDCNFRLATSRKVTAARRGQLSLAQQTAGPLLEHIAMHVVDRHLERRWGDGGVH